LISARRKRSSQRRAWRWGTAASEFAIALPLLIVLCLTSVDFGRFAYAYIALGNAGRVGAERGATRPYSTATAEVWQQQVSDATREDFAASSDLDVGQLSIQADAVQDAYGLHRGEITVSYPFTTVVSWPGIPRPLPMERTIVFRRFR